MLPSDDRRNHMMPWDCRWEHIFNCLDLAAKVVLNRFSAFCIIFPDRSISDIVMTARRYLEIMPKLRYNAVRPLINNKALRRTCRLELFIQINLRWFDESPGRKRVIHKVQEDVLSCPNEEPKHYGSFVRP